MGSGRCGYILYRSTRWSPRARDSWYTAFSKRLHDSGWLSAGSSWVLGRRRGATLSLPFLLPSLCNGALSPSLLPVPDRQMRSSEPAVTPGPGVRRCDFAARRPARPWVSGTTAARAGKRVGRGAPSSDLDKAASYPGHRRHHRHHRLALQAACPSPGASGGGTGAPGAGGARSGP